MQMGSGWRIGEACVRTFLAAIWVCCLSFSLVAAADEPPQKREALKEPEALQDHDALKEVDLPEHSQNAQSEADRVNAKIADEVLRRGAGSARLSQPSDPDPPVIAGLGTPIAAAISGSALVTGGLIAFTMGYLSSDHVAFTQFDDFGLFFERRHKRHRWDDLIDRGYYRLGPACGQR